MANRDPMLALMMAALVGGGGTGLLLPKVAPQWYRPDPATGHELRELEADVRELRTDFHEFLKEGPREVRANQTRILGKLGAIEKRLDALEHSHRQ